MLPWRWHVRRVRLTAALAWCLGAFCFALLLAAVAPMALGARTYSVQSGSMTPAIRTGDVIVSERIPPVEAEVGDIVTFKDPAGGDDLITHRARVIERQGERIDFITRGDANNSFEHWSVPVSGEIGRTAYRIPALGYPLSAIGSVLGQVGLIAVPALLLCCLGLLRIWSPERVGSGQRRGDA
ncbi:MAG: signal peptidase I [Actinomycetota bacterium]|nr:signal peptidase I [Actinomycetota bacterium]